MNEPKRTDAATAANRRRKQERMAGELREAGWLCTPPHQGETQRPALKLVAKR